MTSNNDFQKLNSYQIGTFRSDKNYEQGLLLPKSDQEILIFFELEQCAGDKYG